MRMFRGVVLVVCCLSFCALAQDSSITKDKIIQMMKAGLSDEVIVGAIQSDASAPKLSTDDLIALKGAGASDAVLRALVAPQPKLVAASATTATAIADPDDPMSPHDPGIYLRITERNGGKRKLVLIERAGAGHEKTANVWGHAFSYGISKAKVKAEIPGARAAVRSTEPRPELYMYFPSSGSLGDANAISSPTQFSLQSLEKKKDHRETTILKVGFAKASGGTDESKTIAFNPEKIRPYTYKVTPVADLVAGEYAFIAATGMGQSGSVVIYDFGVDLE